jgi:hypothetical protein
MRLVSKLEVLEQEILIRLLLARWRHQHRRQRNLLLNKVKTQQSLVNINLMCQLLFCFPILLQLAIQCPLLPFNLTL